MHDTDLQVHRQIRDIDARLRRFERQAGVLLASLSALLMLAVIGYSLTIGIPL